MSTTSVHVEKRKWDGSLAAVHPIDLSALVIQEAVKRADLDPRTIDDVLWGCAMPEASQGLNVARLAVLRARLPVEVPAATVNRFCSSGLQTIASGAQAIMSGMADVVIAGGVEMMSQVPMSGYHTRLHPEMTAQMIGMGYTAERVAERWQVSREDQDAYALGSHRKAADAQASNAFADQIVTRAFTDRLKRYVAVHPGDGALGEPDRRRHGGGELLKGRPPKQVRNDRHRRRARPARRVQRNLVDILNEDVKVLRAQCPLKGPARFERKGRAGPHSHDLHPIEQRARSTAGPAAAQQDDLVPARREPAEDFVQVSFGAAGLRILPVLPVDDQDAQIRVSPGAWPGHPARH